MPGQLIRRFKVDNPDHGPALLRPVQNIHGIQIDVEDPQPMKLGQCLGDLYRRSDMTDHLGRHPLCADCRRQWKLVEQ
jgi:hypothetical protein